MDASTGISTRWFQNQQQLLPGKWETFLSVAMEPTFIPDYANGSCKATTLHPPLYSPDHMPSNSGRKIQKTVLNGKLPTKWPDSEDAQKEEEGLVASEP